MPVETIEVMANIWLQLREHGKKVQGGCREGHNVFTDVGRQWLAQLISYQGFGPDVTYRDDRVRYIGVGEGTQVEVPGVVQLINATQVLAGGNYIKEVIAPPDFPSSTRVQWYTLFAAAELSTVPNPTPILTEAGIFSDYTGINPVLATNAPAAYKTFEPLTKTTSFTLEVRWEFRF